MKVSREQAAENRERIIEIAAKLFREKGFDGIGVADLMKSAGLTHGGFYGHFTSKEDLMAKASARAFATTVDHWKHTANNSSENPLVTITNNYLSPQHRDQPGMGCVFAALGADTARQGSPVRHVATKGFNSIIDVLTRLLPGRTKAAKREKALATYASLVGALVLSRAVDDPSLSEEILQAVSASLPTPRS